MVIRQTNGDWGFPKGHMEQGETEEQTAVREISEEVGLSVILRPGFREELFYPLRRRPGHTKNTVYFLAEFEKEAPVCQPEEVSEVVLLNYEKAMQTITFQDLKQVLSDAHRFLQGT